MRSRRSTTSSRGLWALGSGLSGFASRLSRASVLIALVLPASACATARPAVPALPSAPPALQQLRADLASLLNQPGHQRTTWGIAILSLATGEPLYEVNRGALLVPASALKIVTAAAATAAVGWDYTFETTASLSDPVETDIAPGDLIITGTGDPSLEGRGGTNFTAALVAALRERLVRRIRGRIIGNDNLVEEPRPGLAWSWDDLGVTTGALAGGLNLRENTTRVTVMPGSAVGAPTQWFVAPDATDLAIVNRSTTVARGTSQGVWAERRPGETAVTLAGTMAITDEARLLTIAVGNPTLWVARLVRSGLVAAGIDVPGPAVDIDDLQDAPAAGTTILTHRSRPLRDIVSAMLKDSINMYADAVLRLATGPAGSRVMADAAAAAERQLRAWGITDDAVRIVDGSGLSRFNLVTADALVRVLKQMHEIGPFVESLPIAGVDGSLEARMKDTPAMANARAKTGSMTNVRSLAGYVTTRDGEPLAFAILANNFEGSPATVISAIDQMVVRLASFSRR